MALEVCARARQGAKHNDATIAMITGRMDTCLDEVGASSRRIRRQSSAKWPVNGRAAVFHGTVSNGYVLDARREAVKARRALTRGRRSWKRKKENADRTRSW